MCRTLSARECVSTGGEQHVPGIEISTLAVLHEHVARKQIPVHSAGGYLPNVSTQKRADNKAEEIAANVISLPSVGKYCTKVVQSLLDSTAARLHVESPGHPCPDLQHRLWRRKRWETVSFGMMLFTDQCVLEKNYWM